jgi:hypothetical protein
MCFSEGSAKFLVQSLSPGLRQEQVRDHHPKFEGGEDCWIFSNESYLFHRWQKPDWRLPRGRYFIKMELFYESKVPATQWLSLLNDSAQFEDWSVTFVDGNPFQ